MAGPDSIRKLLYSGAAIDPAGVAVQDGEELVSFDDLISRIESAGDALCRLAPDPGSRVAICAGNHCDHLVAYLAILLSGRVWVPLNPANGRIVNDAIMSKAAPELVLVDRASRGQVQESETVRDLGALKGDAREFEPWDAAIDDIAAINFTGGTTGEPKGVIQTHGNMLAVIENMQAFYEFGSNDCNLAVAPLTHGSSHFVIPVLAAGGRHRFVTDRSASSIVAALRDGSSIAFMPPTLVYKLMQVGGLSPGQFPQLRHLTYSAAPMPPNRIVDAQRAFGPVVSALYGQTEAPMTICALATAEMGDAALMRTVGKACRNSKVRVVDDHGVEVPRGATGHIEARGPIVMCGYLDDPELTEMTLHDGWLKTGDLGSLDEAGYLNLCGRASEVIISGGFNVHPAEIESVLGNAPGVRECCVFSVDDDYWGERIEAAIVCDGDAPDAGILAFVKGQLGPVRTPKALHRVEALPRNAVGKVVRREMASVIESLQEREDVRSV